MATLGIYLALMSAGLRGQLQYRMNFVMWVLMGVIYQTTGFVFIWVVLTRFQTIGGWTFGEIAFLYGLRLLAHGANLLLFGYLWRTEDLIVRGEFDRFLVRPIPPLLQVIADRFPVGPIGDFAGGVVLFVVANALVAVDWSALAVAYLALAVLGGALLEAGLKLALSAFSFRFLRTGDLVFVVDDIFSNFANYPVRIFGPLLEFLLTFGVPVAFVAYFPSSVLLGRADELAVAPAFAYLAPLAGAAVFALAYAFWSGEIRHYQSSGH